MREIGSSDIAVQLTNVSKRFEMNRVKQRSLLELVTRPFQRRQSGDYFWPLTDVSFELERGTTLGIIGENGAGKSTLLKLIARILEPTGGIIEMNGRVAALLELGAGFHPDLTGRENIYLNGSIMGLSRREISHYLHQIIDFADIGPFIDVPVKHYSSGMRVRLGFSVAVHVRPDIMLVDEVLAVGDEDFQHKCLLSFYEFLQRGGTLILVSHNIGLIRDMCHRTIWVDEGRVQADGTSSDVLATYLNHVHSKERNRIEVERATASAATAQLELEANQKTPGCSVVASDERPDMALTDETALVNQNGPGLRWGDNAIRIDGVRVLGRDGVATNFALTGDPIKIEFDYTVHRQLAEPPVIGVAFMRHDGLLCYGTNTQIDEAPPRHMIEEDHRQGTVSISFDALNLLPGVYFIDLALQDPRGGDHDYYRSCARMTVRSLIADSGITRLEHAWCYGDR